MAINIGVKFTPFNQVTLVIGGPSFPVEEIPAAAPIREEIRYQEPQETASRIYEIRYQEKPENYVAPLSTG